MFLITQLSDAFKDEAIKKFLTIYREIFKKDDFNSYLDSVIDELNSGISGYESIEKKIITSKISYIRKTKQRFFSTSLNAWVNNLNLESKHKNKDKSKNRTEALYKSLINLNNIELTKQAPKEFSVIKEVYEKLTSIESLADTFEKSYGVKDFNEYVKKVISEIYTWTCDNDKPLCTYKYLKVLTFTKKRNWFKKDLELHYYKFMYLHRNLDCNTDLKKMNISPMEYNLKIPVDPSNRKTTTTRQGNSFLYVHKINDFIRVKTLIIMPNADKDIEKQKLLNLFDTQVIKALIKLSDEDFFVTRRVVCDFGDLVKKLSSYTNERIYKNVHDSLKKISSYQSIYENELTGESRNYDIYKADIIPKSTYKYNNETLDLKNLSIKTYNKLMVDVTFSQKYISLLLQSAIFTNDEISCKSNMAEALIVPLQCERYKKLNDDTLTAKLGYNSFFNAVLTLGKTNKYKNLKKISEALDEIKSYNSIIKSHSRNKDFFYIEFYPLLKNEKDNLLNCIEFFANKGLLLNLPFNITE